MNDWLIVNLCDLGLFICQYWSAITIATNRVNSFKSEFPVEIKMYSDIYSTI